LISDLEAFMAGEVIRDPAVIEIRTYRARPGQRERLMAEMRKLAFPVQRRLGMRLLGPFPSLEDTETFVWVRAFPTSTSRDQLKRAFYEGPEWTSELQAKPMPLLEEYGSVLVEDDGLWQQWPGATA
jgi:hypothetical protein